MHGSVFLPALMLANGKCSAAEYAYAVITVVQLTLSMKIIIDSPHNLV